MHAATSPDEPWERVNVSGTGSGCNNPSPWVMKNGTIVVACTWFLLAAEEPEGPWRRIGNIPANGMRKGQVGHWEDPYLFQDQREYWHTLSHACESNTNSALPTPRVRMFLLLTLL